MPKHGSVLLYVHRNRKVHLGRKAQDGHLDFHTGPELCVVAAKTEHNHWQVSPFSLFSGAHLAGVTICTLTYKSITQLNRSVTRLVN